MIDWHTALDDFLLDLVSLIAEQLELAKKDPSDQCAAVEVAIGAISVIKRRLREDEHETAIYMLYFSNLMFSTDWQDQWRKLAKQHPDEFSRQADNVLEIIEELKKSARGWWHPSL